MQIKISKNIKVEDYNICKNEWTFDDIRFFGAYTNAYEASEVNIEYVTADFRLSIFVDGEIAGFASAVYAKGSDIIHNQHLFIRSKFRRLGLGDSLFKAREKYVRDYCRAKIFRSQTHENNKQMQKLLIKNGYKLMSKLPYDNIILGEYVTSYFYFKVYE